MRSIKEPNPDDEPPADEKPAAGGAVLSSASVPRLPAVAMATLTAGVSDEAPPALARNCHGLAGRGSKDAGTRCKPGVRDDGGRPSRRVAPSASGGSPWP